MRSRFSVWMNGQGLQDVDGSIYILDVEESEPSVNISTAENAKSDGMHILNTARESLQIAITAEVHEYSIERRAKVIERMQAWAQDGALRVNYRPGQRLECVCTSLPSVGSALRWTSPVSMAFTAFVVPYWLSEDLQWAQITTPTTYAETALRPTGTAKETPLWFTARNESGETLNTMTIACPDTNTKFLLGNLGIPPGGTVEAGYTNLGYLYIKGNGASVMNRRTADSTDDVLLKQQYGNTIVAAADAPATFSFSARGRWL